MDHLRQLLMENNGPEADAIKAFFQLHGEVQGCATCLILATLQSLTSSQISEWAIRAFFKYGGMFFFVKSIVLLFKTARPRRLLNPGFLIIIIIIPKSFFENF